MQKVVEYSCAYCGERFIYPEDCEEHEKTHLKDYSKESNKTIAKELYNLKERAWGYHIGDEVLGMPYSNFANLMETAANRIKRSRENADFITE